MNSNAWENEPDDVRFNAASFACALHRGPSGHWCGYVGLPPGHPWWGLGYDAQVPGQVDPETKIEDVGIVTAFCASIHLTETHASLSLLIPCHGGLTYAGRGEFLDGEAGLWYLGFDAAHSGDLVPRRGRLSWDPDGVYRDEAYMRASVVRAAETIAKLTKGT